MVDLGEYKIDKGEDGKRLTFEEELENFDETVKFVKPSWGDKAEFSNDFGAGTPKADRVDSGKLLKFFKRTFKDPDFSQLAANQFNDLDGDFVQELLDILGNLYNHPGNRDEEIDFEEADQKK